MPFAACALVFAPLQTFVLQPPNPISRHRPALLSRLPRLNQAEMAELQQKLRLVEQDKVFLAWGWIRSMHGDAG